MLKIIVKQLQTNHYIVVFNSLALLLFLTLIIYLKSLNRGDILISLFSDPFLVSRPYIGTLSAISEILWCISLTIGLCSFRLLQKIRPSQKTNLFIFYSTIGIAVLFFDDVFRINLLLKEVGIPKLLVYLLYGTAALVYGLVFRRIIRSTPYVLLLIVATLFIISGLEDSLPLPGRGMRAMLEDGTRLLGILNLTLYFRHVCWQAVLQSLNQRNCRLS